MGNYDVAAGSDQTALNSIASSIYKETYPKVFKGTIHVAQFNIDHVDYDIQTAPTFSLTGSEQILKEDRERLEQALSGADLEAALEDATKATLTVSFSSIQTTIHYSDGQSPTTVPSSLTADGAAETNSDGTLSVSISGGTITIPGEPIMSELLNKIAIPGLISYLNEQIFKPIKIPTLSFKGVTLTVPQVATQNNVLLGFASMVPNTVVPPPAGNWPTGVVFAGGDARILNTVADNFVGGIGPHGDWHWHHDILLCDLKLNADYNVKISNVQFDLKPDPGNSLTASLNLSASAGFSTKCGRIPISFSATATATPTATASVKAVGSQVMVTFDKLSHISFKFHFSGVPGIIPGALLTLIANAFSPVIAAAVTSALSGASFEILRIPTISASIAGVQFNIHFVDAKLSTISAPDGVPLVTVTGLPEVTTTTLDVSVFMTRPGETEFKEIKPEAPVGALEEKASA